MNLPLPEGIARSHTGTLKVRLRKGGRRLVGLLGERWGGGRGAGTNLPPSKLQAAAYLCRESYFSSEVLQQLSSTRPGRCWLRAPSQGLRHNTTLHEGKPHESSNTLRPCIKCARTCPRLYSRSISCYEGPVASGNPTH